MRGTKARLENRIFSEPVGLSANDRLRLEWLGISTGRPGRRKDLAVPFYGLLMLLDGRADFVFADGGTEGLAAPAALLFHKDTRYSMEVDEGKVWRLRYLLLSGQWVADWVRFGWWPAEHRTVPLADAAGAERMHQCLLDAVEARDAWALERAKFGLMEWVCGLGAAADAPASPLEGLVRRWREAPAERVDLPACARACGMGYSRFREAFKERFKTSPYEYHLRLRIGHARFLLEDGDLLVKEIAWLAGFRNVETFQRHFRSRTGLSPARYRRQARALR